MKEYELKSCPFCGEKQFIKQHQDLAIETGWSDLISWLVVGTAECHFPNPFLLIFRWVKKGNSFPTKMIEKRLGNCGTGGWRNEQI